MKVLLKQTAYIENISYSRPFYIMDTISVSTWGRTLGTRLYCSRLNSYKSRKPVVNILYLGELKHSQAKIAFFAVPRFSTPCNVYCSVIFTDDP